MLSSLREMIMRATAEVFGQDVRSLAVFRMAVASTMLVSLTARIPDIEAHYSDRGVLPRELKLEHMHPSSWELSVYFATGNWKSVALMFGAHMAALVCMFVGYKTQMASILCWIFEISIQNRNRLLLNGGDQAARLAHLYSIFLPLGQVWSLDAWLRVKQQETRAKTTNASNPHYNSKQSNVVDKNPKHSVDISAGECLLSKLNTLSFFEETSPRPSRQGSRYSHHNHVFSLGTAAITIQVAVLYLYAGLQKSTNTSWSKDWTALEISLHYDDYVTPLGESFRELCPVWALMYLTRASHLLETLCPFFILLPLGLLKRRLGTLQRGFVVICFLAFHLQIRLFYDIGMFSFQSMTFWVPFIPGDFWEGSLCNVRFCSSRRGGRVRVVPEMEKGSSQHYNVALSQLSTGIKALLCTIIYIVVSVNVRSYHSNVQRSYLPIKGPLVHMRDMLGLEQNWGMFSSLTGVDGWYENIGVLRGNASVDIAAFGGPVPKQLRLLQASDYFDPSLLPQANYGNQRPQSIMRRFAGQRWKSYLTLMRYDTTYREAYAKYICTSWNGMKYRANKKDKGQLLRFDLYFHSEPIVCEFENEKLLGSTGKCKDSQTLHLLTHTCF